MGGWLGAGGGGQRLDQLMAQNMSHATTSRHESHQCATLNTACVHTSTSQMHSCACNNNNNNEPGAHHNNLTIAPSPLLCTRSKSLDNCASDRTTKPCNHRSANISHLWHLSLRLILLEGLSDDKLHAGLTSFQPPHHVEHGVVGQPERGP